MSRDRSWFEEWLQSHEPSPHHQSLLTTKDIAAFRVEMETPVSLLRRCRQAVVWNLNTALHPALDTLPIPEPIKEYLSFNDIDHVIEELNQIARANFSWIFTG